MGTSKSFTFNSLPKNLAELQALPEAALTDAFAVAALTVLAYSRYEESVEDALAMIDFLNGPNEVTAYDKQFIKDRFSNCKYVARSYFEGTSPQNNYQPSVPYTVNVRDNPYSYQQEGYCTLWLKSSGADSERSVNLRQKPSTGQWFLNQQNLLGSIRTPVAEDPWA